MKLEDFDYLLPDQLIATQPLSKRSNSRMLVLDNGKITDSNFANLLDYLSPGDLLVCNNSKVIPAQLDLVINNKIVSIQLDKQISKGTWSIFAKPGKKLKTDETYFLDKNLSFKVLEKDIDGRIIIGFSDYSRFDSFLEKHGKTPLPPYIQKFHKPTQDDKDTYQTVYAQYPGSVAAPTAGLHFDEETIEKLRSKNINLAYVTLHVGSGTFLPIKSENIKDHKIHSEYCEVSENTANLINQTKSKGGKVVAVGTTSMRTIEFSAKDGIVYPFKGECDLYIMPGYKFQIFDKMITNFHLPKSSLLVLVSAFSGHRNIKLAYEHAIKNKYRFYSYGDCCLLNKYEEKL